MKVLIKERLSPNKYVTHEGYLICKDAILARTGKQQYRKSEVFDTFDGDDDIIDIDRNPKEVFSDATLASFENKPITVEHPQENVDSTNWKQYQVGFVRDVKRDVVDGQDVILGTLVIQDKDTIDEILNGEHTDLSCGYECDIVGDDKTGYSQINIRGNHVALCQEGRAGIARIIDSKVEDKLSYEAASSDDSYLDEVEKMIYKFANVRVDAMLVGNKLKIAAKNSKGFTEAQLQDIVKTLSKYVDVSNITTSNPNKFDSQVTARIVDSKIEDATKFYIITKYKGQAEICESLDKAMKLKHSSTSMFSGGNVYEVNSNINWYKQTEKTEGQGGVYSDLLSDVRKGIAKIVDSKVEDSANYIFDKRWEVGHRVRYEGRWYYIIAYNRGDWILEPENGHRGEQVRVRADDSYIADRQFNNNYVDASYKVRDVRSGYAVVVRQYWINYGMNAFVDRICYDLDEAKYVRNSLERADKMSFVIIDCNNRAYMIVDSKGETNMKDADKYSFRLIKKKNEYDEFCVKCYKNGKYYEDGSYYTDDWQDAVDTIKAMAKRANLEVKQSGNSFVADCNDNCNDVDCNDSFVEEPRAKDELIKALSDYKLTDEGKTVTGKTYCLFKSTKKFDKVGFNKEASRIIAFVKNIKNKYDLPDTTYSIGMKNDGTIVVIVDLGRKYVKDSKVKDSIKQSTLINLTKIVKIIKNNKR